MCNVIALMTTRSPIPFIILTGFLGSGKTTLLNRILSADHGLKIAVLVNDFGAVNIDAQLVVDVDEAEEMVSLSNGCVCCTIRGDLLTSVEKIVTRDDPPDWIVLETSGVSDPIDVVLTLRPLETIRIESVLTMIDAENLLDTLDAHRILAMNQIGTADLVLLNKVDLVDEAQLAKVRQAIQRITRDARIIETVQGDVPLGVVLGAGAFDPAKLLQQSAQVYVHTGENDHAHDHGTVFHTWHWESDQPLSLRGLRRTLDQLPKGILRAKGVLYLTDAPDERAVLHLVGKRVEIRREGEPWGKAVPRSQIVVIGAPDAVDPAQLKALFTGTIAGEGGIGQLVERAFSWLRR